MQGEEKKIKTTINILCKRRYGSHERRTRWCLKGIADVKKVLGKWTLKWESQNIYICMYMSIWFAEM